MVELFDRFCSAKVWCFFETCKKRDTYLLFSLDYYGFERIRPILELANYITILLTIPILGLLFQCTLAKKKAIPTHGQKDISNYRKLTPHYFNYWGK